MSGYLLKPADQDAVACIDWTQGYLEPGEFIDGDLGWALLSTGPGDPPKVVVQSFDDANSYAQLREGAAGGVHMLVARAVTNMGRELERSIVVRIAA